MSVSRRDFLESTAVASALFATPSLGHGASSFGQAEATTSFPIGYEALSKRSLRVLSLMAKQAEDLNHWYQGTEHLLLALFAESETGGRNWLNDLCITHEEVACMTHVVVGAGDDREEQDREHPLYSDNLLACLDNAVFAARESGSRWIEPEHMMIGIVESFGTTANLLLQELWMERGSVRQVAEASLEQLSTNSTV